MSWLLDADVLSQPAKSHGDRAVIEWFVTGNDKDFRRPGLKVFNPFKELASIES